uniref:Secreted RxLR effector protein 49 n=1 Tax=Plasmopara viticola TaxID=143451 RepID=RLR49_PLAVT|nr:RecName: Full=Secreted RxLR effector protein 49; Flags: Precursor [Plasmopara viticola]ANC73381.1 secreted RxLR effector peptide protein 49 [Plasmopara viticola]
MIRRSPLVAVILFVAITHVVLALDDATRIDSSEIVPSEPTRRTRVSPHYISSGGSKRSLRQQAFRPVAYLKNKLNWFLSRFFGTPTDAFTQMNSPRSSRIANIFRKIYMHTAKDDEYFSRLRSV